MMLRVPLDLRVLRIANSLQGAPLRVCARGFRYLKQIGVDEITQFTLKRNAEHF